ncbi:TetR/AcrR family transcriptional regulator [Microbacterium sp. P04]|uniref:TetR/AcrR family transcriptional regulator n=1 Tax=Microbacterium sp. P04 TaxID=3366947 RepID=UPI003745FF46
MDTSEADPEPRVESAARRTGRPFDRSSDASILASTLDLLAERDYERLTVDEVAARTGKAKTTLYRRWATKEDLVLAAIRAAGRPPEVDDLPDLGSLRSDLLAVVDSPWLGDPERRMAIFAGLASATRSSERMAAVIRSEVTDPYVEVYRRLLQRALHRGEISAAVAASIPVLSEVIPAMSTHRLSVDRASVNRDFFVSVIDDVLLPALRGADT